MHEEGALDMRPELHFKEVVRQGLRIVNTFFGGTPIFGKNANSRKILGYSRTKKAWYLVLTTYLLTSTNAVKNVDGW